MSSSESTVRPTTRSLSALFLRLGPLVAFGALALAGCTADYSTDGNANVLLVMQDVNGGAPMDSDVRISSGGVCPDGVSMTILNTGKNPNVAPSGLLGDVFLERYEVSYIRSDGRGTEGVDVPFTISGSLTARVPFGGTASETIELVRRQAKVEPPLSQLAGGGGPFVITMFAQITVHGRTVNGQATNAAIGRVHVDFADFNDANVACPTIGAQ